MTRSGPVPFHIDFRMVDYGLRAHVQGINGSLQTTLAYWRRIAEEVRRLRPASLMVVDDMEGDPPPPDELLVFVRSMQGEGLEGVRVAYVERHLQQLPQVELAGILACEHGFNGRVFASETTARLWLRYGES